MPLKPNTKTIDASKTKSFGGTDFRQAALFKVDPSGKILSNKSAFFLLNPSTYEESKGSKWAQHDVPGQSDPVLQWVASGPRTVTFDALITKETSEFDNTVKIKNDEEDNFITKVADLASSFFKVSIPGLRQPRESAVAFQYSLDISNYLNYYRSLLYPLYNKSGKLLQSPPLLVLCTGTSIARAGYGDVISSKDDLWVLTDLRIKVTKQLPNLAPMEAVVSFTLLQYNIRSFGSDRF